MQYKPREDRDLQTMQYKPKENKTPNKAIQAYLGQGPPCQVMPTHFSQGSPNKAQKPREYRDMFPNKQCKPSVDKDLQTKQCKPSVDKDLQTKQC